MVSGRGIRQEREIGVQPETKKDNALGLETRM
jgi:hypothetical protein